MASLIMQLLREQQRAGWPDLAGVSIRGTLPVTDALILDLIRRRPPPRGARVIGVTILPEETVRIEVVVGASLLSKRLAPELRITGVHGLPGGEPSVTAEIPWQYGRLLSRLLRRQLGSSYLGFEGNTLTVALRPLVAERWGASAASMLSLVKRADLRSERGRVLVDFEVAVP